MVLLCSDFVNVRLRFSNRLTYIAILGFTFPRQITKNLMMQKSFKIFCALGPSSLLKKAAALLIKAGNLPMVPYIGSNKGK